MDQPRISSALQGLRLYGWSCNKGMTSPAACCACRLRVPFAPPTMRLVAVHAAWPGCPLLLALSDKDSTARCQDSSSVSVCVQQNMHRLFTLLTMVCCPADV